MRAMVWTANVLGWPVIQLSLSAAALRLPDRWFARDSWLTKARRWERGGRLYVEQLQVRRWKEALPDGGGWLGGFEKKRIVRRDAAYLAQFAAETRRAEWAHWAMLACLPVFFLWNPPWACGVMTAYALAANVPIIVVQRSNRLALVRLLRMREDQGVRA